MKMQRSECEAGNVQFVQELAEVDGPFEAPININFRDLTKLELPALVWNRSDSCPRKMKITNTGHTVIVSAKWKCERPYLTGGPLVGKYVFSQIHFHWGQTDCRGSEHQICGEQFPLEMHVAHFKTDYMTQESALREKDGMVVIVYLFKLQEEPNHSLKKIINSLPRVRQPSTSYAIDPRPIVSLCHPFTEDYFMYWGSVVTSTCAHILLWIICREPFGISKEQVSEFRKIMDSTQQPIFKNSRDIQPLHKRNVFHVNASKHLESPLLPIKKRLGCYCREGNDCGETFSVRENCYCQGAYQNQEDVEGSFGSFPVRSNYESSQTGHSCFVNQTFVVQTATVGSLSLVLKRSGSDPVKNQNSLGNIKKVKSEIYNSQVKIVSKSCCFYPPIETNKVDNLEEKRKVQEKTKLFHSVKGFSQVLHSLEVLKKQTFKKLKKIETINQEIKEMKPFCQDKEDKRWIRKIEKVIMREKRSTLKSSQGCLTELKKLAKDCNFDNSFVTKALPEDANSRKRQFLMENIKATTEMPYESFYEEEGTRETEKQSSRNSEISKTLYFSSEAQKLIQSFFEDIKDTDDLEETVTNDPNFIKIKSLCSLVGDSKSVSVKNKGYITQRMFNLGNLGDRFFKEVTTEDVNDESCISADQNEKIITPVDVSETKTTLDRCESEKLSEDNTEKTPKNVEVIPLHRVNTPIMYKTDKQEEKEENRASETLICKEPPVIDEDKLSLKKASKMIHLKKSISGSERKFNETAGVMSTTEAKLILSGKQSSSINFSLDSTDIQKVSKSKINKQKSPMFSQTSPKKISSKTSVKKIENIYIQKKNLQNDENKNHKDENIRYQSFYGFSSVTKEEMSVILSKPMSDRTPKTKIKFEVEKTVVGPKEFVSHSAPLSPERRSPTPRVTPITDLSPKHQTIDSPILKEDNLNNENKDIFLKEGFSEEQQSISLGSSENDSRTSVTNRTYKASSADSKTGDLKEFEDKPPSATWFKAPVLEREMPNFIEARTLFMTNCRSLTSVSTRPRSDFSQRLQIESIDDRKKTNVDAFAKTLRGGCKIMKDLPLETSDEVYKYLNKEKEQKEEIKAIETQVKCSKSQNTFEYELGMSTETSSQMIDELLPKVQLKEKEKEIEIETNTPRQRLVVRSNQYLENRYDNPIEILHVTDSDKPFLRNNFKREENFLASDNKSFQTSVSCSTIKRNSTSRPHSAETLHSLKKTQKRRSKKRPHCSKRNSRHYIRKNYSVFKKPSKPFNFLSLTDEEQLKIISVNVANYIKQKLLDEKSQPETEKNTSTTTPKELKSCIVPETKPEKTPPQESSIVTPQKNRKFRIPVLKPKERTKEKENDIKIIKKPNTAESQSEKTKPKAELNAPQRPVNNFIKLNKQMAGTYKRATPTSVKKLESKEKLKPITPIKQTNRIPRPKAKTQKKTKEKLPDVKPSEPIQKPQNPRPLPSLLPLPKEFSLKEKKKKIAETPRISDSSPREIKKVQASSQKPEKPNKEVEVKYKLEPKKAFSPPKTPREKKQPKKSSEPICDTPKTEVPAEKVEDLNENEKNIQREETKQEIEVNTEGNTEDNIEEIQKEALFKKELEYFITMQMYLNNGLSTDPETQFQCFSPNVLSSCNNLEESLFANDSFQNLDFSDKEVVVVKKTDLKESSSSCSQFTENPSKISQEKDSIDEKEKEIIQSKQILTVKAPTDFDESSIINPIRLSEDSPSDSSYDCKISITLNTVLKAQEVETEIESQDYETYCMKENCISQTTTSLGESSSHLTDIKPDAAKKESEMSLKMKRKLLELLEGELKREMGIGVSSSNSSHGLGFKAGDSEISEANLRIQSTESSSDNIEGLAQLSNTMKQYLNYLREIKGFENEGKDYGEF